MNIIYKLYDRSQASKTGDYSHLLRPEKRKKCLETFFPGGGRGIRSQLSHYVLGCDPASLPTLAMLGFPAAPAFESQHRNR